MNNTMKKALVIALSLAMTVSTSLPAFAADTPAASTASVEATINTASTVKAKAKRYFSNYPSDKNNVSVASFLDRAASNEKMTILDIRDAADYEKGHIEDAINVPYGVEISKQLEKIPDDRPVMVYCYSGQTASQTVALLRIAGKQAYNVSGGYTAISKNEKAAKLTTAEPASFRSSTYDVSSSIVSALKDYYTLAKANGKFNMSPAAVKEALAKDEIFLLDVRSRNDHLKSWISGVDLNIPFGNGMQNSFSKLPKDKKIVVQCYSGQTASQTVAVLRLLGYDAYNMSGGTGSVGGSGWLGADYRMEKASTQQFLNAKVADYFANLPDNKNQISAVAFLEEAKTPRDICIIDIRDSADYEKGPIRSAVNVPYGTAIAENLDKSPNDRPVYVYCYTGQTASQTVMLLNLAGKNAINVSGGWNNGISKAEGVKELTTTSKYTLKGEGYTVDADIAAAIKSYYENIAKEGTNKKGNISVANAKTIVDAKNSAYQVVDLRSAADYTKGHIEGAINVPFGKGMQTLFSTLPNNKTLILQCYSGQTASQTMAALRIMGYKAYNLSGGMSGWTGAGNPLVK